MLPSGAAHIPRMSSPFILPCLLLRTICFCLFTDKGVAKIARQLGFDHAEAVVRTCSPKLAAVILPHVLGHRWAQTSFEFRKGKAFPVISGIVVAAENEDTILEASVLCSPAERNCSLEQFLIKAYWEVEHAAAQ